MLFANYLSNTYQKFIWNDDFGQQVCELPFEIDVKSLEADNEA